MKLILNEEMYKGYNIKWVTDKNHGRHVEVYKDKEFMASYRNAEEARDEIDSGEIEEEVTSSSVTTKIDYKGKADPLHEGKLYFKEGKVSHEPIEGAKVYEEVEDPTVNEEINPFKDLIKVKSEMKPGLYTDGFGGVYKAPKTGMTKKYKYKKYQFAYDFKQSCMVIFYKNRVVDSVPLSLADWLDNPEYYMEYYLDDMEAEVQAILKQHPEADPNNAWPSDFLD